ncbi:type II toxin-antitoxin system HipA family toxin [Muribacter muris]|uniref:Type II toxin-antitoxin system HipA family toxin n=1 Tax=Muribacter muris TaxID=67855 RepID=A0A4Y9JRX8_9PAST|nr:HipA domain-containing protein [Muribacter muris]MBF0785864.1 HipA domain-containing protein [Muribacter muris]MBF0827222.1 HipA domain-containing protein [Muribacter muris]TFV08308.1 type II toxin-antitoxin system HipA family toxin [Muribacter muris]
MRCPITLKPLLATEYDIGYSRKGLKALTGNAKFNPMLNFDSQSFENRCPLKQKGMSISGYQPKLQLIIQHNQFDIIDSKGDFILKPSPTSRYPFLAENEHATMQVMNALKFNVPENGLVYFKTQEPDKREYAFVIKRYDRVNGEAVHQEQLDGAMGIAEKYGKIKADGEQYISYERAVKFILDNVSDKDLTVKKDLFLRIVYAYLLGNNDLHLRNFSLIATQDHLISLAPVYDFVSVKPYPESFSDRLALPLLEKEEGGQQLAHGFETKYGCYLGMDFVEFGTKIGLSETLAKNLLINLVKSKEKVIAIYQHSFMPKKHIEQVIEYYQQRLYYLQIFNEPKL